MTLTAAQRAEQNRSNATRSKGPTSTEGKSKSRGNALKHGLRAEALSMPGEDPALAAARSKEWHDHYRPRSPAARQLVNECVRATLLSDRIDALQAATAAARFQKMRDEWDGEQAGALQKLVARLPVAPAATRAALESTAAGCRWLIEEWEELEGRREGWYRGDAELAVLLLGGPANPAARAFDALTETPDPRRSRAANAPAPADPFVRIAAVVAAQLTALRAEASRLTDAAQSPDLAAAAALCLIPENESTARLYLRYQAEARTAFHRALKALDAVLKRDESESGPEEETGQESASEAELAVAVGSPNEAESSAVGSPNEAVGPTVFFSRGPKDDPTVRDEWGRPTNMVNMCMVPAS